MPHYHIVSKIHEPKNTHTLDPQLYRYVLLNTEPNTTKPRNNTNGLIHSKTNDIIQRNKPNYVPVWTNRIALIKKKHTK